MNKNKGGVPFMQSSIKIGVLTYTAKHRKTYDVLCLLKATGYTNVVVYARPFHYVKKFHPMIEHRPQLPYDIPTETVCKNFGYEYMEIKEYDDIDTSNDTIMLVCGAGILPHAFIETYRVINAHPGYIPNARGLDSLKWAIVEKEPIGVTTHLIGDLVDAGEIINRVKIPIYESDSFHTVALKVYEKEIELLVNAIEFLESKKQTLYIDGDNYIVHKRMPVVMEENLYCAFEEYKKIYVSCEE